MAGEPIEIVYEVSGMDGIERESSKAAKAAQDLAAALENANRWADEGQAKLARWAQEAARIAQELNKINALLPRTPNYGATPLTPPTPGNSPTGGSTGRSGSFVGPYQRLDRINEEYARAAAAGAPAARMKDLDYARDLAQTRVNRLDNPRGGMDKVFQAVLSSRFGFSGGSFNAMPLIGRSLGALGVGGAAAGPIGLAVTGAIALAEAMKKLADQTSAVTREFADLKNTSGGTQGDSARLRGIGGAIGMSPGEIASLSRSISDRISSDPVAMGFGQRFGAVATPGPWGTIDTAGNLLKIVKDLRAITDETERLRTARVLGAERLLPSTNLSDATLNKILGSDAATTGRIFDPAQMKRAAEYQASVARMSAATDNLLTAISGPVVDDLTALFNRIADVLNFTADIAKKFQPVLEAIHAQSRALMGGPVGTVLNMGIRAAEIVRKGREASESAQDHSHLSAMVENSHQVALNTDALVRLRGMIGGGERARNALPSAVRGPNLVRALELDALASGTL